MSVLASLLLGALLGVVNAAVALWVVRRAGRLVPMAALRLVLASMTARMAAVLAAFALIVGLTSVDRTAFVGGFGLAFVLGTVVEVALVAARPSSLSSRPVAADA